jgi:7,8-dihydropterin-6-yl-methyl-4-(beta-D-ribofuranosyl)aminobenzene 5'-phosphate synthase
MRFAQKKCLLSLTVTVFLAFVAALPAAAQQPQRITILYDAFGKPTPGLEMDWGYASLVEYGGRRVLFDTGNDAQIFARNVKQLGVDLTRLDAVVISHRHGDHTSGLTHLLAVNPGVKIYVPVESSFFKAAMPRAFLTRSNQLPAEMKYFNGQEPARFATGSPWEKANFEQIAKTTEIFPGFFVLTSQSPKPGTIEMNELSLAFRTSQGLAVVVGCSHAGVEKVLEIAATIDPRLYIVTGGFHLVLAERAEVERVASILYDTLKVQRVAPGHCTSELGFAVFMDHFKDRFDRAGLGATIRLP